MAFAYPAWADLRLTWNGIALKGDLLSEGGQFRKIGSDQER
jgi:hypothetical protein